MYLRHVIGKKGEDIATKYLINNGYRIIERNFNCKQGEIDIIAKYKGEIVFVEVKTRTNKKFGLPVEAITKYKIEHLKRSIEYYICVNNLEDKIIRIDAIEIYIKDDIFLLHHIKQAI